MSDSVLTIDDLHVSFRTAHGEVEALVGVSLDVQRGEIFGIVGETGCGKTVTGLSILDLLPDSASVTRGLIEFEGMDVRALSAQEREQLRGRQISMIFQNPATSLNPVFSIGDQMIRVIREHLGFSRAEARDRAHAMLESVGLPDPERLMSAYPHQLSGGMQQRVMIALALSCEPSLLIADEPTTALDVTIQAQILAILRRLREDLNISIVLITHDLGVVAQTCDRVAVLYAGRVVEIGSTRDVFENPRHPYTQGLIAAVPRPDMRGGQLTAIPGTVPSDPGQITGCTFAPRCTQAFNRCRIETPGHYQSGPGHISACFLDDPQEVAE